LFGYKWFTGKCYISSVRLGAVNSISSDQIVYSDPIFDIAKKHIDSQKEGLAELHRIYTNGNKLSAAEFYEISI
jgi:hypothetical protein